MKRNSTVFSEFRKLLVDVKQQKKRLELTSERLPQILKQRRVGVDGIPTVIWAGYKVSVDKEKSVSDECVEKFTKKSGTA